MCGIAGVFTRTVPEPAMVERMVRRMVNRGPDSEGYWGRGSYRAGMRRLSIVDVVGGDQPLTDDTGRIVLFYNGEIYNYPLLRGELERKGVLFRTRNDGEVICHLYRQYGRRAFERLDGMFAIALWDDEKETLFLARDFPGEKPLYVSRLSDGIAFASTISSLLECNRISRRLDVQALWDYPTFLWVPEPATIYENVRAILPGEGLQVTVTGAASFSFRKHIPSPDLPVDSDEDAARAVRTVVGSAVSSRLLSDVPVGAFLSGGLDSSIVCTLAAKQLPHLQTFCVGFEDVADPYHGHSDESVQAHEYARKLGTSHTTVRVTGNNFRRLLPMLVAAAGQPYAVSSGLGILAIAREAQSRGIKVLLSGDGADEAFGGYSWYPSIPTADGIAAAPQTEVLRFLDSDGPLESRVNRVAGYAPPLRAWAWHYYASEEEKAALFHADIRAQSSIRLFESQSFNKPLDYIRHDRDFYFPNEMLSKVDRMGMAFSVEGRSPFAAPCVQKLAARLSWDKLVREGQLKWILRRAFVAELPLDLVARPKHGFNVPIDHWLKGDWADLLEDTFSETSALRKAGIIDSRSCDSAHHLLDDPRRVSGHVLFTFIMLNLWLTEVEPTYNTRRIS